MSTTMTRSYSHVETNPGLLIRRSSSNNNNNNYDSVGLNYMEHNTLLMMEKRQLFLRSYQFSRKKSLTEKFKSCLVKAKRVICVRLRSARKLRRLVWSKLRSAFYSRRRTTRFLRLLNHNHNNSHTNYYYKYKSNSSSTSGSCFW